MASEPESRPATDLAGNIPGPQHSDWMTMEPGVQKCYKCDEVGHLKRDCQVIKCYFCGGLGHLRRECPQNVVICRNCSKEGHFGRDCPEPKIRLCSICKSPAHLRKDCPSKPTPKCRVCGGEHRKKDCTAEGGTKTWTTKTRIPRGPELPHAAFIDNLLTGSVNDNGGYEGLGNDKDGETAEHSDAYDPAGKDDPWA